MNKNYTQKIKVSVSILTVIFSIIPSVSKASFFDWWGSYGSDPMSYSNSVISQGGLLYSNSIFNQGENNSQGQSAPALQGGVIIQPSNILSVVPSTVKNAKAANKVIKVRVTAYSSTPDQTDANPFITASGTHVRDGIVATNILPFKTLVKFPSLFGDKVFVVEDRMNARYTNVVDVWFPDRQSALNLGNQHTTMVVVGSL